MYTTRWEDFNMFRFLSMILLLSTIFIVGITAELKPLNDKTTVEIMNKLPVILIPSTYVFLICILIFVSLIFWLFKLWQNRFEQPKKLLIGRTLLFNTSLILHILCIFLWHYELFTFMISAFIGLLGISAALYFSYPKTENHISERIPISLYFGWNVFSFMFLSNYTLTLVEWTGWGISQALWSVIFLTVTTAVGLHFLYHYRDLAFNSMIMWGFISIAIKNGFDSLFVTTASLFLTAVIAACYFIFKNIETHKVTSSKK